MGGYIEKEENLSQEGDAWICGDAQVYGDARICGNAWICGDARICKNSDYVSITGFGDNHGTATFFREKDGAIRVRQGHFYGNLEEYREQAGKKAEYRLITDLIAMHFRD